MTISIVQRLMNSSTHVIVIAAAVLTVTWLVAVSTSWLDPPGATATPSDANSINRITRSSRRISLSEVDQATRGKAIFRTYREAQARSVDEIGRYELVGVSGRGKRLTAHFRDTKRNDMFSKNVGETVGPYEVVAVEHDGVVLERGNERLELAR